MFVNPYAQRKAELLWIVDPANAAVIDLAPALLPSSFASCVVISNVTVDFIVHDERVPRPAYDKFRHFILAPSVVQHEWHLRTRLGLLPGPQYADARDRTYILDVLHPYLFREFTHIIESVVRGEDYAPQPIPEFSLAPRRSLSKRPERSSQAWMPHSRISREVLAGAVQQGTRALAGALWSELGPRYQASGNISPATYDDSRIEWEWRRMTTPRNRRRSAAPDEDDLLTLDDFSDE